MMKRFLCCLLIAAMLFGMMPSVFAAETRGVSLTTDSAFFNAFTLSKMPKVQSAVSAGNYTLAKQELLNYYTAKFANYNPVPASPNRSQMVYLASQNAFAFSENYLSYVDVTTTDYTQYKLNLGTNKTGTYVLSMLNKTNGEILIPSSEASSMVPQLIITCSDGTTKTLNATADAYVRAGSYASTNYGSATTLYVHDDYSGTTPYSTNTKRVYIKFDTASIPSNASNLKLAVYAKRSGTNCESSLRLNVFAAYSTTWTESGLTWNWLTNNSQHGHFSWDGISGGFTWTKPSGTPTEWLNYNTRFYEVSSLVQSAVAAGTSSSKYTTYLTTAKNLMLDFINDAGAGKPANRSIEPANRLMEFPYIYKHLLAAGLLTPAENVKLLAWVYDEAVYMNGGATLFTSSNSVNSAQAYTNHGFWHLTGFYQAFGFFSEFAKASTWRSNYNVRQPIVLSGLLNDDGSYNEVTFGYPSEVVNWSTVLLTAMSQLGDTSSVASTFKTKLVKLAKYMVDNSQPNGTPPAWGQGGPGNTKTTVQKVLTAIGNTMDNEQIVQELRYYVNHANGVEPKHASEYDDIKVVADRTGWNSSDSMIFMNARCGGNHAHRDANALLFYYNGRSLLADTGMTSYDQNHAHYSFQNSSTDSHNTIEIDGTAQYWTQYLSDTASRGNIDIVSNDGLSTVRAWTTATTNFTHYRNVSYIKGLDSILLVTDKVVPSNSNSHTYRQTWHCAPYSNPSIASDVYDTGKTAYSSGANLIIAQAYNTGNTNLNANITATLQTGYDASAASTTTKYFEYKQTKSGVATYQTVLYPVPQGATATVTPLKLSMTSTADDIALATRIAIEDSSRPDLKVLYHYNSFESTPSTRAFGGHTTDASTAMLALNKASDGAVTFAAISNGSTLYTSVYNLLTVSQKVTDISVQLDGTTLYVESSDPNISFLTVTTNLHAQTVTKVLLNGKETMFDQAADGTVTVGGLYLLTNFDNGDVFANTSDWKATNCTAAVNVKDGLLSGSYSNTKDPYLSSAATLAYTVKTGDVVELRIKNNVTAGAYTALQLFYTTKEHTNYTEDKSVRDSNNTYPNSYVTVQMPLPAAAVGQVLTSLRIDPVSSNATNPATGTFDVDYIYVGPAKYAPSSAYKVTFCNADGTVLETVGASEGGSVTYTGATPTKAYDATNHYTFAGWVDANGKAASLTGIKSDLTVYASFTASAHTYTSKVTTAATCEGKGVKAFTCSCGRSYTEAIAALGHNYDAGVITTMPTLTAKGVKTFTCQNDKTHTYTEAIDVLTKNLYFGFDGTGYNNAAYGFLDFDKAENWYFYKDVNASALSVDTAAGTLSVTAVGKMEDTRYPCVYFDTIVNGNYSTYPLNFDPDYAEVLQVRVKLENFAVGTQNTASVAPYLILQYFVDSKNEALTGTVKEVAINTADLTSGQYIVLTANLSDAFRAHGKIDKIRVFFGGIESISESKVGKLTVDYVYVGSEADMPTGSHLVTFLGADGKVLATQKVLDGQTAAYTGATPTKAADASYHYTFKGWDKALSNVTTDLTVTAQFNAVAHTKVIDKGYAATCQKQGLSDGAHCSVCSYVIAEQTVLPIGGHSTVVIPGIAATCTSSGVSDGEKCSVCGLVTLAQTTVPRLGHSYTYIDNGDGMHHGDCIRCDKTTSAAAHAYENGECVCGAKEVVAPIYDEAVKFSHSLTLENDISINFIGLGSALIGYDSFYLECKVPVYNGNELVGYETVTIEPVYNGKNYECTLLGITAKMMNDEIEAVFHMTKDGQEYYSKTDVYSVAEYAYGKLDSTKATDTAELKTVCANLLRYGSMAQTQFAYRTDALVDAKMTATHKTYLTDLSKVEMKSYMKQLNDLANFTVPWKSATLELGNKVIMCLIANLSSYAGDPSQLTMRLSYIDSKGQSITVERPLEVYNPAENYYAVSYDVLRATEMRTIVSAAIYLNGERVSKTVEYSIESYGGRNPSDLCRAMLAYGDSANAFFAN